MTGHGAAACLLLLSVLALLNGVSAQGVCNTGGVLDYFPTNTNNTPEAWSYGNQTAAGNAANTSLLPVALYGIPWPKLNFLPRHWTLRSQAAPPAGCGLVQSTRRLQAIATQRVTQPAQFTYTWQLDARAPVAGGQTYSAGEATTPAPAVTLDLYALNFTSPITNGLHTLTITTTILARTGTVTDSSDSSTYAVPNANIVISQVVTFYIVATDSFGDPIVQNVVNATSCSDATTLSFKVSNLGLAAAALPNGSPLFQPVYYIYGNYKETFDGSVYDGSEDTEATGGKVHDFSAYILRPLGAPDMFTYSNDNLVEGYYSVTVESAVTSDHPELMSLAGAAVFGQSDVLYATIAADGTLTSSTSDLLVNKGKWAGHVLPAWNKTRVAVSSGRTLLTAFSGPPVTTKVTVGSTAMFTFQFSGLGNATCTVDGAPFTPDASSPFCTSPVVLPITDTASHTLAVTFTNICGVNRTALMDYGFNSTGSFVTTSKTALDVSSGFVPTPNGLALSPTGNGAEAGRVATAAVALVAAVAALLLL